MSAAAVSSRRRRVRIALAAAALFGVGAAALVVVRASRHGRTVSTTALGPFRVGEEVRSRARVTVRLDLGRGTPPQELELEGEWRTTVTEIDGALARVACELGDLRATAREGLGASARESEAGAELAGEIGRRFFVSQRADGSVFDVWLPRGLKPAMANILLTLAGEAQLVRPAQAQPAWIVEERDVNGAYLAAYQETAPGHFHKQKARYLDVAAEARPTPGAPSTATAQPHIRIDRSDIDLLAAAGGRVLELRADDATTVELAGISFGVSLRFTLDQARMLSTPALAGAFAREREKGQLEGHPMAQMGLDPAAEAARRDRALLAGASADDLVAELRAVPPDAGGGRVASTVVARWEALMRLEPATAARVPALVLSEPAERAKLVVDASSAAGTDEAQAALGAIATNASARPKLRQYAIQYLGLQRLPAPAAVTALRALLDDRDPDLAQAALLALGACARSLRATAPERTREIVGDLHARLGRAARKESQRDLIVALGNAGDPSSLVLLRGLIEGKRAPGQEDDVARTVAVEALRFIDDPAVDSLLGSLLGPAADSSTRFAAIAAIRFRDVGPFTVQLADIARHDKVESIRRAAIDLLGSRLGDLPALRPLLEEVAHRDPEPRNRELAARYLARG